MKVHVKTICFILLLATLSQHGIGQCNFDAVNTTMKYIPNEPQFELTEKSKWSVLPDQRMQIHIDTSNAATGSQLRSLSNENFGIYTTKTATNDSSYSWQTFIRNRSTGASFIMGGKEETYSIDLKNCFIRFCNYGKKEMNLFVFDYKKSAVSVFKFNMSGSEPVGYNDTSIFLAPASVEFQRKKYGHGTIISLNENGIGMIKPVQSRHERFDYGCEFYSTTFSVYKSFLYRDRKDCDNRDHCMIKIKYLDVLVDSFEVEQPYYAHSSIRVKGDTLTCMANDRSYRKYTGTTLSGKWELSGWVDSLPVLKYNRISYYNQGDLLVLTVQCPAKNKVGLQLKEDKWITLNDVPLKPESTDFSVLLLFDIKKNKFLGYPKLAFTNE